MGLREHISSEDTFGLRSHMEGCVPRDGQTGGGPTIAEAVDDAAADVWG